MLTKFDCSFDCLFYNGHSILKKFSCSRKKGEEKEKRETEPNAVFKIRALTQKLTATVTDVKGCNIYFSLPNKKISSNSGHCIYLNRFCAVLIRREEKTDTKKSSKVSIERSVYHNQYIRKAKAPLMDNHGTNLSSSFHLAKTSRLCTGALFLRRRTLFGLSRCLEHGQDLVPESQSI